MGFIPGEERYPAKPFPETITALRMMLPVPTCRPDTAPPAMADRGGSCFWKEDLLFGRDHLPSRIRSHGITNEGEYARKFCTPPDPMFSSYLHGNGFEEEIMLPTTMSVLHHSLHGKAMKTL